MLTLDWTSTGNGVAPICSNRGSIANFKAQLDSVCNVNQSNMDFKKNVLTTTDDVTFYQYSRCNSFAYSQYGSIHRGSTGTPPFYTGLQTYFPDPYDYNELTATYCAIYVDDGASVGKLKFDTNYRLLCMDVDGPDGPIKPFGYGIRRDGKIATGLRADWWLEREITKKETDCCPKALKNAPLVSGAVDLCDTSDTVCTE